MNNYRSPHDINNTPWRFGARVDVPYFTWLFQPGNEDHVRAFSHHMEFKAKHQKWYEAIPIEGIFPADFDPQKVLMVDVGGSVGHDILGFHKAHPAQPGRLVLQDLAGQIDSLDAEALKPVEGMVHDFFTEQPVKGAKAYYLKMVLHDWPDEQCKKILANLRPALVPGYSKILINEIVIAEQGADSFSTLVDIIMMMCHASKERRENEWRRLVESVGLKIVRIHSCGGAPEKLIEVELA